MLTRWRLTRPVIGAITWVNSILSWAAFSAPSATGLGGVRGLQRLAALVDDLFGDCTGLDQVQPAVELALGKLRLGARIRKLAVGLRGHRLERAGIDDVKQVAGMDHVAVFELDIGDEAADPGADLDLLDRVEAPGEFVPVGDGALDRLGDRDRRRSRGRRLWRLVPAGRQRDGEQNEQRAERRGGNGWRTLRCYANASILQSRSMPSPVCMLAAIDRSGRPGAGSSRINSSRTKLRSAHSLVQGPARDQAKSLCIENLGLRRFRGVE